MGLSDQHADTGHQFCCEGSHMAVLGAGTLDITSGPSTTNAVNGLYLQRSFSLDPPEAAGPLLLRGWDACLGLLGSPSDSSAGPEGDNPRILPLSSLREKTHVSLKFSVLSLLTDRQGLSWGAF